MYGIILNQIPQEINRDIKRDVKQSVKIKKPAKAGFLGIILNFLV
jgi:hypothetical protein